MIRVRNKVTVHSPKSKDTTDIDAEESAIPHIKTRLTLANVRDSVRPGSSSVNDGA